MVIVRKYEKTIDNLNQILELLSQSPIMDEGLRERIMVELNDEKNKLLNQYGYLQ